MKKFVLVTSTFLLHALHSASACVGCREPAVTNAEEPQTVMAGVAFSWGVLIFLAIVFLIIGGLTWYISQTCQRLDQEKNYR